MEESSILLTLAQISVEFVGFAGIIATFQFRDNNRIKKRDAVALEIIIHTGLMVAFLSVLPLVLSKFGLENSMVWLVGSGIICLNYLSVIFFRGKNIKKIRKQKKSVKIQFIINLIVMVLVVILNLFNSFDFIFNREFGPYLIALICPLGLVGVMFSRLLFLPIWKTIRKTESEFVSKD